MHSVNRSPLFRSRLNPRADSQARALAHVRFGLAVERSSSRRNWAAAMPPCTTFFLKKKRTKKRIHISNHSKQSHKENRTDVPGSAKMLFAHQLVSQKEYYIRKSYTKLVFVVTSIYL